MAENRLISLHPKLASICDGLFSIISIWWLSSIDNPWYVLVWFVGRVIWWGVMVNSVYYPPYISRIKHFIALFIGNIGAAAYLVFGDPSNLLLSQIFSVLMPALSFWLIPAYADNLSVMEKPHRRWKFFMSVFGVSGIWLALAALSTFQIIDLQMEAWGLILGGLLTAAISAWEWTEYGEKISNKLILLTFGIFLIVCELSAIVFVWPIGYFVSGFFITWLWYLTWLLFRFNLSQSGIDWSKQKYFIFTNIALMAIFLGFVVRWK